MAVFDADWEIIPDKQILTSPRFIRLIFYFIDYKYIIIFMGCLYQVKNRSESTSVVVISNSKDIVR
jgi:hypothetical protein